MILLLFKVFIEYRNIKRVIDVEFVAHQIPTGPPDYEL